MLFLSSDVYSRAINFYLLIIPDIGLKSHWSLFDLGPKFLFWNWEGNL